MEEGVGVSGRGFGDVRVSRFTCFRVSGFGSVS